MGPSRPQRLLALAISFTGTVALWWCYFERAEPIGTEAVETADDAGTVGWRASWTLTLIVLALIAIAVGDELAIAHPDDEVTLGVALLTFGGPALFLIAQALFLQGVLGRALGSRLVGVAALAVLGIAVTVASLTLLVAIAAASAILVAVAVYDTVGGPLRTDREEPGGPPASQPQSR